jgi:hypothetical protein
LLKTHNNPHSFYVGFRIEGRIAPPYCPFALSARAWDGYVPSYHSIAVDNKEVELVKMDPSMM